MKKSSAAYEWPNDLKVGFHLSIADGPEILFKRVRERGFSALQVFSGSPRTWAKTRWKPETHKTFLSEHGKAGRPPLVVHTRYLINIASAKPEVREKSIEALRFEYEVAENCDADFLVLHMGSHSDKTQGLKLMLEGLEESLSGLAKNKPMLLLENTAGERNDLGSDLADIARLRKKLSFPSGLCFDTCHGFQAGYDLRSASTRQSLSRKMLNLFGPDGVKVIHLNDSMNPFNGRHDRHEDIDQGKIGGLNLASFLKLPLFNGIAVIMETPKDGPDDPERDFRNLECLWKCLENC